jgi:hypothetical protein
MFTLTDYFGHKYIIKSESFRSLSPMISIGLVVQFIVNNLTGEALELLVDNRWLKLEAEEYKIAQNSLLAISLRGSHS